MSRISKLVSPMLAALAVATPLAAQADPGIGGMRAYWHVFIAYTIVILLVLGWVVSIGRRLKDIQDRLDK